MFEFLGVLLTWVAKWYKSGKTNKHRKIGFILSVVVSCIWVSFFLWHQMYWLAANSVATIILSCRGILNNPN